MRLCDNQQCRICKIDISTFDQGLSVSVPSKKLSKMQQSKRQNLLIDWDMNRTSNFFHQTCWNDVSSKAGRIESGLINQMLETIERFETVQDMQLKVIEVAKLMKSSKQNVCFTGAGVSVSAGIPTYRGADGIDTVAAYGIDIENSNKRKFSEDEDVKISDEEDEYIKLHPTFTHRSLTCLNRNNLMNYCITQNCDNLHERGGFPRNGMIELHGNVFVEYCELCHKEYIRDYCVDAFSTDCKLEPWYVKCRQCSWNHYTGRKCTTKKCKGKLKDTIVNFGDDLHSTVLGGLPLAITECKRSDVCLCLGSSLTVTPANELPAFTKDIVICNLQETELDDKASIRIWGTCDMFFTLLMRELDIIVDS